jgi:hypothetical protein
MATRTEAGTPHISTAYFCFSRDFTLYFLSHPRSVHCHNLTRVPQMAVAVFDSHQSWGEPHAGLQLHGTGMLTNPDAGHEPSELYAARFPRYREFLRRPPDQQGQPSTFSSLGFYRFSPERVQILDEWEFGEEVFISASIIR